MPIVHSPRKLLWLPLGAMLFSLLAVATSEVHDFDTFWQLQSGRYMVETGSFIRTDLFTLAADAPRFEHCWLHDLILFWLHALGGYHALSLWKGVVLTLTALVLVLAARARGASLPATLLVLPVFLLTSGGWVERPQLWTFLLFALFILLLEWFREQPSRQIFWLVPLAVFWANVHAGSVLGVAILAAYLAGLAIPACRRRSIAASGLHWLLPAALLVVVGSLLSPYPAEWLQTLRHVHELGGSTDAAGQLNGPVEQLYNMDWTLTSFQNMPYFYYALAVTGLVMAAGWRRFSWPDLFLLAGLALMGLKLVRHTSFFFFAMVAIIPGYLDAAILPLKGKLPAHLRRAAVGVLLLTALSWGWYFYRPLHAVHGWFATGLREWHFPVAATEFVRSEKLSRNLYNTYDWGGYLAWQLYPEYLVFWDSRQDSAEMFRLGWLVMAGDPRWQSILDRFAVNTIVTRSATIDTGQRYPLLDRLRESSEWSLVFADDAAMIFVRDKSVDAGWLEQRRLGKERIDVTILATARLMTAVNPGRYLAWWEMASIYLKRGEHAAAFDALEKHLGYAPEGQHLPQAEKLFRTLYPMKDRLRNR